MVTERTWKQHCCGFWWWDYCCSTYFFYISYQIPPPPRHRPLIHHFTNQDRSMVMLIRLSLWCFSFVLNATSWPTTVTALSPSVTPTHLHPCFTAHRHSVMPAVITVGHNFRDNLKTIYYPRSIKKTEGKHFLDVHLRPIGRLIDGSLRQQLLNMYSLCVCLHSN